MIVRRRAESQPHHDRWVISYADFITLLFAFFVVMYSISSVNDGKYRVLSDSITTAFEAKSSRIDPASVGESVYQGSASGTLIELPVPGDFPAREDFRYSIDGLLEDVDEGAARQGAQVDDAVNHWSKLSDRMADAVSDLVSAGEARVVDRGEWLEVNLQSSVLFEQGSATLAVASRDVLQKITAIIATSGHKVQVEGHTDNVPIDTDIFPSNWELSAARAGAVVRALERSGIPGDRLAATGYGEFKPVADNATADGRRANRRIALLISRQQPEDAAAPAKAQTEAVDFKLKSNDARDKSPPEVAARRIPIIQLTLEQARQRWQIQPRVDRGAP